MNFGGGGIYQEVLVPQGQPEHLTSAYGSFDLATNLGNLHFSQDAKRFMSGATQHGQFQRKTFWLQRLFSQIQSLACQLSTPGIWNADMAGT